jgi:hypothetical protein
MAKYKLEAPQTFVCNNKWHYDCLLMSYGYDNEGGYNEYAKKYSFVSRKSFSSSRKCFDYARKRWFAAIGVKKK